MRQLLSGSFADVHPELEHHRAVVGLGFFKIIDAVQCARELNRGDPAVYIIQQWA